MGERHAPRGPGVLVFACAALVLSWLAFEDVGFRDAGELGSAAAGLGVAHPTGFGVDLLFLRVLGFLPLGHQAFRQNLMVAWQAAAALGLLAELCDRLARRLGVVPGSARTAGGAIAALGLGTWPTFVATAVSVEVYSLALLAVLLAGVAIERGRRAAGLVFLIMGLAPGLHVTAGIYVSLLGLGALLFGPLCLRFVAARLPVLIGGALIIAYLPLASRRDPALDWGDPETLSRIWDHLSAARVRSAFQHEMLGSDANRAIELLSQLAELWPLLPCSVLAVLISLRRRRFRIAVAPLALIASDLAYALWINPMGIADRQVGHVASAGIALLSGLGAALACAWLEGRKWAGPRLTGLAAFALGVCLVVRVRQDELHDAPAASELLGSGGALASLPPRAVLVCRSDDGCAAGLFATLVERVRPDIDVLPAQHLWDPTVRRRIEGLPRLATFGGAEPVPLARAAQSRDVLRAIVRADSPRPLFFETPERPALDDLGARLVPSPSPPYLELAFEPAVWEAGAARALARLDGSRAARLIDGRAVAPRARLAWSRAYGAVGESALGGRAAVAALRTAVALAPERPVAWTNLGVAFERIGELDRAIECMLRAIELQPQRSTPWVNLLRFQLARRDRNAAERTLAAAREAGVRDARLTELAARLETDASTRHHHP
jgi:tetratricopeptide (TPR) repeat protein